MWRLNILQNVDSNCVLCNNGVESVSHLFFTCDFAGKVWNVVCCCWGYNWVISDKPEINFESWFYVRLKGESRKIWISGFYMGAEE